MKKNIMIAVGIVVTMVSVLLYAHFNQSQGLENVSTPRESKMKKTSKSSSTQGISSSLSQKQSSSTSESSGHINSQGTSSSVANDPNTASYNPNKTAQGTEVTAEMITKVRQELIHAGLPADKWGPSDIKKIITESSQQNMSVIDYAKANYHQ